MKISIQLLISLLLFSGNTQLTAQQPADPPFKRFAFQAGANISNMNFNKGYTATLIHQDAVWKTGFTLGFLLRVPLAKNLFLQPEYAYTQRKGADKTLAINYSLDYLSMPVLLNYKITPAISILAGPQFELLMSAKSSNNGVSTGITHDTEERSIGITGGLELEIKKLFFISARYLQGLNHIGIGQRSNVKEFEYQAVNLTVGVRF
jgi:Outer membrane protein beta-barrel domain